MNVEIEATVTEESVHRTQPATDPCESCGTPLMLVDVMAMIRSLAGLKPGDSRRQWMESRQDSDGFATCTMRLRPHTPERCRRVRAGDPEPWTDPEDDDERY
jgi:hypothetical protein